jgi:hypothetical protein
MNKCSLEKVMDLDEAILHAQIVAQKQGETICGDNHRQLAKWLTELKELKSLTTKQTFDKE